MLTDSQDSVHRIAEEGVAVKIIKSLFAVLLLTSGAVANAADTFDFVSLANPAANEKGYSLLSLSGTGYTLNITGTNGGILGNSAYAYLDSGHGGLGVCGALDGSAQCAPSSDDNVTTGEVLRLQFDRAVTISSIWFNNLHDSDYTLLGNNINISGAFGAAASVNDYSLTSVGGGDWATAHTFNVAAGQSLYFQMGYTNPDQFYMSRITVTAVPEPETYAMLLAGLGLLGFAARRRKQNEAATA